MITAILLLDTIDLVREFVDIANTKEFSISLKSKDVVVDGKSIMSVFGLDLTKPVIMEADTKTGFAFLKQIDKFIYKK
jgi:phosphotransferase system HPr-like phosphotransfer protein